MYRCYRSIPALRAGSERSSSSDGGGFSARHLSRECDLMSNSEVTEVDQIH